MLSCLLPVANVAGRSVTTLEGWNEDSLQRIFHERFAVQCGYCAPGMLMTARALLDRNPSPTREEIAEAIAGNVCRCTGYESIIDARETWLEGRLIVTPHAAFFSPEAWEDMRRLATETARLFLFEGRTSNVVSGKA